MSFNRAIWIIALICSHSSFAATEEWVLDHSTVTYTIHHPLKTASGTSTGAKGKGKCEKGTCEFLIAVPVKTFDSGDSNRDLHMLEVTRGGENPMVVVRTSFVDPPQGKTTKVSLTLDVQFAGKEASYRKVSFDIQRKEAHSAHTKGTITIKLSDFAIKPPSLLTMSIKDEVPIEVDAFWKIDKK